MEFKRKIKSPAPERKSTLMKDFYGKTKNKYFHKYVYPSAKPKIQSNHRFSPTFKSNFEVRRSLQFRSDNEKPNRNILKERENININNNGNRYNSQLTPLTYKRPALLDRPVPGSCPPKIQKLDNICDKIDSDSDDEIFLSHKYDVEKSEGKENLKTNKVLPQANSPSLKLSETPKKNNFTKENFIPSSPCGLGFANYGNTCYINAVLQSLVTVQAFVDGITLSVNEMGPSLMPVTVSLSNLAEARMKLQLENVMTALREVKEAVGEIDMSFAGSSMHDASEFLTRILDIISDEYQAAKRKKSSRTPLPNISPSKYVLKTPSSVSKSQCNGNSLGKSHSEAFNLTSNRASKLQCNGNNTDHSQITHLTPNFTETQCDGKFLIKNDINSDDSKKSHFNSSPASTSILMTPDSNSPLTPELVRLNSPGLDTVKVGLTDSLQIKTDKNVPESSRPNPVSECFGFELFESYECLSCRSVEARSQFHSSLFLNISSRSDSSNPDIKSCIDSFFSKDKREKTCSRCNHSESLFTARFKNFPKFLIITLKRFEFNAEERRSVKVSRNVEIDLRLNLNPVLYRESVNCHSDSPNESTSVSCRSGSLNEPAMISEMNGDDKNAEIFERLNQERPISTDGKQNEFNYKLIAIINHHGKSTCSGHYTCDSYDRDEKRWRNYDDEKVSFVDEDDIAGVVRRSNGYVFMYSLIERR